MDDEKDDGMVLVTLCLGTLAIAGMVFGVRMWDKAGADIRAANAQERIADVLERSDVRPQFTGGAYMFSAEYACTKQKDQRTLCGRP